MSNSILTDNKWNTGNYKTIKYDKDNSSGYCPLEGIQERSQLSDIYFSKANMELLQKLIIYNVWMNSKKQYNIGEQNNTELIVIMRSMYLQYSKNLKCKIKEQIRELNDRVVKYSVEIIITNIKQHKSYINQLDKPLDMIDRGISTSITGNKLKEVTEFI